MTTNTRARRPATTEATAPSSPDWLDRIHGAKALPPAEGYSAIESVLREMKDATVSLEHQITALEAAADESLLESVDAFNENQAQLALTRTELERVRRLVPLAEKVRARVQDDGLVTQIRERYAQQRSTIQRGFKALERYAPLAKELAAVLKEMQVGYEAAREIGNAINNLGFKEQRSWQQCEALCVELFGAPSPTDPFHPYQRKAVHELVQLPSVDGPLAFWGNIHPETRPPTSEEIAREQAEEKARAAANPPKPAGMYDGKGRRIDLGHA
ncbi:hypothetical protein [Gemmatimonas sp.]